MVRKFQIPLLLLLSVPALSPLFTPTLTRSADGVLHLYRLVQLDALWRNGIFFSRWLPDVAFGYGMPVFNYYAPLAYYLTTPLHLLGLSFPLALNLSLTAAMFAAAVGMYYFACTLWDSFPSFPAPLRQDESDETSPAALPTQVRNYISLAALVAALAYLYSPYILFNALQRTNLAEQWALAFAPLALWRFLVLIQKPTAPNSALAILTFTAVMLSHNVTSFLFAPLLFVFALACLISLRPSTAGSFITDQPLPLSTSVPPMTADRLPLSTPDRSAPTPVNAPQATVNSPRDSRFSVLSAQGSMLNALPFVLSSFLLALAFSSFFWLPALLERDFVQIARVIVTPDFDYRFNFVPPLELAALLPRADTGRVNPSFPSTLGLVQIVLAALGIISLVLRVRTRRIIPLVSLAFLGLEFIALMLSLSQPVWDNISLLSFIQLPMRLRGLVALCLAPLTGVVVLLPPPRWRTLTAGFAIVAVILTALPMLYPRYANNVPLNPILTDMFAYEQRTGALGTTSFGEYLPVWVQNPPDKSPFENAYARGEIPDRFVVPENVNICGEQKSPTTEILCASASDTWRVIYRAFYFPGWVARVQDSIVPITPTPRTGLISFDVAGRSSVSVTYAGTLIENLANALSIAAALLVLGIIALGFSNSRLNFSSRRASLSTQSSVFSPQSSTLALLLLALALIALKFGILDRVSNPFVAHFDGAHIDGMMQPLDSRFDNEIQLLGVDVNSQTLKRGETLRTSLYWRALPDLKTNLSTFVHLTAPDGFVLAQQDSLHPANLPTTQWDLDAYAVDEHTFEIPPGIAPGVYELRAGVYDPRTNLRLQNSEGKDYLVLANIQIAE